MPLNLVVKLTLTLAFINLAGTVKAEARFTKQGQPIEPELWAEDARIDPLMYFVFVPERLTRHNKCADNYSYERALEFFEVFNALVVEGVMDDLDVRIVWTMRECLANDEMISALGVTRNTYFDRVCRIRTTLREAFEKPTWKCAVQLEE